jgi:two-component system cell cycle response regulator
VAVVNDGEVRMKKVLTIDDSKVVRSMVTRHLQAFGCEVVEATNGQEGVDAAKRYLPDLILLDVTMPVMDGKQALAAIRADDVTKALPVVMLTAESGRELVVEIVKLGVTGYIVKPFQKESFEKEVSKILGEPASEPAPAAAPLDHRTVLVVDASEEMLAFARQALAASLAVLTATSAEALERWKSARPAVVVVAGPAAAGELPSALRQVGPCGLVAVAARGDTTAQDAARKAGCHAVIEAPCVPADVLEQVLVATAAVASVEEQVQVLLGTHDGCAVLNLPDPRAKAFGRMLPVLNKRLRALASDGETRLLLHMDNVAESNVEVVKAVVAVVTEATDAGLRTAIVTSAASVTEGLRQLAETQDRLFPSREAAREALR